ncbi:MAG: MoaD/ThiS family protein [Desulfobacterales bacterium]|jgi:sulfur carrier protein ThiS
MKVHVRLFGTLGNSVVGHDPLEGLTVELPDNTTIAELIADLGVPAAKVGMVSVNRRLVKPRHVLQSADEVRIFRPIFGG